MYAFKLLATYRTVVICEDTMTLALDGNDPTSISFAKFERNFDDVARVAQEIQTLLEEDFLVRQRTLVPLTFFQGNNLFFKAK